MESNEIYKEVICNFFDEERKVWCVEAWTSPEQEDNGCVIAEIDGESGNVYYSCEAAKSSPLAQEVIREKQTEVRAERKQRKLGLGETTVLLASEVWQRVYDKMEEPNCCQLAQEIRDAAIEFEKDWYNRPAEERDGNYMDDIEAFAEKLTKRLIEEYC